MSQDSFLNNLNKKSNNSVKSEVLRRGQPPLFVLSFNVVPYFQLGKKLVFFYYLITTTSRKYTISLVYYHIKS